MQIHTIHHYHPGLTPAYLANGLIGLRLGSIPLPGGTALVNGFCGLSPEKHMEEYAPAPYPVGADLQVEGVWLSERPDLATFVSQTYDFSCGELRSVFTFTVKERTAQVEVLTFCSRTHPTLVLQEIAVTVDGPCRLHLLAQVDPRGLDGRMCFRSMPGRGCDGILQWVSRGGLGTLGVAYRSELLGADATRRRNDFGYEEDRQLTEYSLAAQPGQRYVLRQMGSLVPGLLHTEPYWQASRLVDTGACLGFEQLRSMNREAWAELWRGRPIIHADDACWQQIADAAFFYLHSSVSPATPCSVAPYGLSRRTEYSGHVFWDTETFMFPPVLLTAPDAARAMLDYRSRLLPAARDNARLNGYRGGQFPWQSGLSGSEVTPFYCGAAGVIEQHVNMDVAFAFAQYIHASGDDMFIKEQGWPVLSAVAEWIVSRVTPTTRGYEIRHVVGPDELIENIHNNSFTNIAAIVILREATACAARLGITPPSAWQKIAEQIFIPIDPATQVILKHDAYQYDGGMCVPETMGAFFPFTYRHSPAVDQATARYHLDKAASFLGMPMYTALYSVWAARQGERQLARDFFETGLRSLLVEPFCQFKESAAFLEGPYGNLANSVFLTNPAGYLLSLLIGLPGLELDSGDPRGWAKYPVVLPEGWEGIEVERLWARGTPMRLVAKHGMPHAHFAALTSEAQLETQEPL